MANKSLPDGMLVVIWYFTQGWISYAIKRQVNNWEFLDFAVLKNHTKCSFSFVSLTRRVRPKFASRLGFAAVFSRSFNNFGWLLTSWIYAYLKNYSSVFFSLNEFSNSSISCEPSIIILAFGENNGSPSWFE